MKILQTVSFKKSVKKLQRNQTLELDEAIRKIAQNPSIGELKKGDLTEVRVYKFKIKHSLILLAYTYDNMDQTMTLLKLGSHENFYRDLKSEIN